MSRVIHFEIHADDPERCVQFYEKAFGWKTTKWEGPHDYWLVTTGPNSEPGIDGGIMKRTEPSAATYNTVGVQNLDETITKVREAGGTQIMDKMAIPGVGWLAYFKDTEGNIFGAMQPDRSAGK